MDDLREQAKEAIEGTARTRYQFVLVELQTSFTGLDMGNFQLSVGNREGVIKEIQFAERGLREVERFAPALSEEQRAGVEEQLGRLREALESLRRKVGLE